MDVVECLKEGKIALLKTDTIWGLSCDATDCDAVDAIYELKKRDFSKPFILLMSDIDMLLRYCDAPDGFEVVRGVSMILRSKPGAELCRKVVKGGKVCARIPDSPFIARIIRDLGNPIVSTSANYSGEQSPASISQVPEEMKRAACCVQDNPDNFNSSSIPSTIVDYTSVPPKIMRKGKYIEKIKLD